MRLPFQPTRGLCRRCGRDAVGLDVEFLCEDCRARCPHFDRAASALRFEGDARQMVNDFKFNNHYWLRTDFADWLEATARVRFRVNEIDAVIPMPATWQHRFLRGFNPCDYLASALARRLEKPLLRRAMRRVGNPARQGSLDADGRRANVVGTFAVAHQLHELAAKVPQGTVLVIDDIMTTGSTLSECAKQIKSETDLRVFALALARSIRV